MKFAPLLLLLSFLVFHSPLVCAESNKSIPSYGDAPKFELTDQNGNAFSSDSLKGETWIANFIFTRCQGMCPLMSGQMANLQNELKNSDVKFVSFSVDPDYDTPEMLSDYAKRFHAAEGKWVFLTGERTVIWKLVSGGFMLGVEQATPEDLKQGAEPVMHSSRFVLVDKQGKIRGFFDSSEPDKMKELVNAAQTI